MRHKNSFKQKVVNAIQGGLSMADAATQFKVTPKTIRAWSRTKDKAVRGRTVSRPSVISKPNLDRVRDAIATLTEAGLL